MIAAGLGTQTHDESNVRVHCRLMRVDRISCAERLVFASAMPTQPSDIELTSLASMRK